MPEVEIVLDEAVQGLKGPHGDAPKIVLHREQSVLQMLRHRTPVTFGAQGTGAVRMQMRVQLGVKMQIAECDLGGAAQCSRGLRHVNTPAWTKLAGRTISLRLRTVCSLTNFLAEQIQTCPRLGQLGRVHQNQDGFLRADGIFRVQ